MNSSKLEIKKHSAIIQMSNKITAQQRRGFNVLLYIARAALRRRSEEKLFRVKLCTLKKLAGIESTNNTQIKQALKGLVGTIVEYNLLKKDKKKEWGAFSLLAEARIKEGILYFAFAPIIHRTLLRPEIYTLLNLSIIRGLTSKYSIALYEVLKDYEFIEQIKIEIENFRKLMGITDGKYSIFTMFRKRVIDTAVQEINEKTDLSISYDLYKTGRRYTEIEFYIESSHEEKKFIKGIDEEILSELEEENFLKSNLQDELEIRFALTKSQSEKVIENYEEDYIKEILQVVEENFKKDKINNIAAFTLKALENDYRKRKSLYEIEKEQKQKIKKEKKKKRRKREKTLNHLLEEFKERFDSRINNVMDSLSEWEKEEKFPKWLKKVNKLKYERTYGSNKVDKENLKQSLKIYVAEKYLEPEEKDFVQYAKSKGYEVKKDRNNKYVFCN